MSSTRTRRDILLAIINDLIMLNQKQLSRINGDSGMAKWWYKYFNKGVADRPINGKTIYGKKKLIENVKLGLEQLRTEINSDIDDLKAANHLYKLDNLLNENAMVFGIKRYRTSDIATNAIVTLITPAAIGTWICPGIGTLIGFVIGLGINLLAKNKGWTLGGESTSMKAWRQLGARTFIEKSEEEASSVPEDKLDAHEQAHFAERKIETTFKNTLDGNFLSANRVIEVFIPDNGSQPSAADEEKTSSSLYGAVDSVNVIAAAQIPEHERVRPHGSNRFFPIKIRTVADLQKQMADDEKNKRPASDTRRIHRLSYSS